MVKYVCILQNIITDYLSKKDKLIKTWMKIIPSYVTQSYREKNNNKKLLPQQKFFKGI